MKIEIVQSSPKAVELAEKAKQEKPKVGAMIYPFDQLEVGQSFSVPQADGKYQSLHAIASRKNKMQNKHFVVIRHDNLNPPVFEVARIA